MDKLKVTIDTPNAAFSISPAGEAARILRKIADRIARGDLDRAFGGDFTERDYNGNTCATVTAIYAPGERKP